MTADISVDLNSDMGEGFGPWSMGDDAAMLISSRPPIWPAAFMPAIP